MKRKIRLKISTFEKVSEIAKKKSLTPEEIVMEAISQVENHQEIS
jgi:predicted transcriptional regulator